MIQIPASLSLCHMQMRRWESPPSSLPASTPEAAHIDGEDAGENSMSTTHIVLVLSSVKMWFDTEKENNQHLDFVDFYNPVL